MKKSILMLDDDRKLCEEFRDIFEAEGHDVRISHDGIDGKNILEKESFDILILDIKIPGRSGFGILAWLKETRHEIRTIVLTGRPDAGAGRLNEIDTEEEELLGYADAILNKPSGVALMLETINGLWK